MQRSAPSALYRCVRKSFALAVVLASAAPASAGLYPKTTPFLVDVRETTVAIRVPITDTSCSSAVRARYVLMVDSVDFHAAADECALLHAGTTTGVAPATGAVLTFALSGLTASSKHDAWVMDTAGPAVAPMLFWKQAAPPNAAIDFVLASDTQEFIAWDFAAAVRQQAGGVGKRLRDTYQFLIHAGDFMWRGRAATPPERDPEDYLFLAHQKWLDDPAAVPALTELPIYAAPGNHDFVTRYAVSGGLEGAAEAWPAGDLRGFLAYLGAHAGDPDFTSYSPANGQYGFSFTQGRARFVVFNASALNDIWSSYATPTFRDCQRWCDEYDWLEDQLEAAERDRWRHPIVVLVGHIMWSSQGWPAGIGTDTYRRALSTLIDDHAVDVFVAGHTHDVEFAELGQTESKALQVIAGGLPTQADPLSGTPCLPVAGGTDCAFARPGEPPYLAPVAYYSRRVDGRNHYVAAHLPADNDRLAFDIVSYAPASMLAPIALVGPVQWGRVPRKIVGRPAPTTRHVYGPYRSFQRYFSISRSGGGGTVYIKKNVTASALVYDCKIVGSGSCAIDLGDSSGSATLWITVGAGSGAYDLSVTSWNNLVLP